MLVIEEIQAIGFSGTQMGMSADQMFHLRRHLKYNFKPGIIFRHGDCIGADAQADIIARDIGYRIAIHPCDIPAKRAFCFQEGDILFPEKPPLIRDLDIVLKSSLLLAAPFQKSEVLRSGTWSTVRRAHKAKVPYIVIKP